MIFLLRDIFPGMFLEIVVIPVREKDGRKNNPYDKPYDNSFPDAV